MYIYIYVDRLYRTVCNFETYANISDICSFVFTDRQNRKDIKIILLYFLVSIEFKVNHVAMDHNYSIIQKCGNYLRINL